jgi:RNA polymerase sigma-70 factor, ECF subfamily
VTSEAVEDPEQLSSPSSAQDPHQALEASQVLDALAELPEPYREAVAAVDVAGLSYAEAARGLGVREGTVMSRVYRGRERVARLIEG